MRGTTTDHTTADHAGAATNARTKRGLRTAVVSLLAVSLVGTSIALSIPTADAVGPAHSYLVNATTPAKTTAAATAATKAGGTVVQSWPQIGVVVVQSRNANFLKNLTAQHNAAVLSAGDSRNAAISEGTMRAGSVAVSAVNSRTGTNAKLTGKADPATSKQTYLKTIGALTAQKTTEGNSRVVVGVLDTGVDGNHVDLKPNFDAADSVNCTNGGRPDTRPLAWTGTEHGTHVAGIIAGAQNGRGIQGVAPHVKVASVKVVTANDETWPEYVVCGFMWAGLKKFSVTNSSYNVYGLWCDQQRIAPAALTAVSRAIAYATKRGVAHVQATGNDGLNASTELSSRCHDPLTGRTDVLHVGATEGAGGLAAFSNYGMRVVDIAAPGLAIYSTLPAGGYGTLTGTSQAAPQAAGALALVASRRPTATPAQLIARVKATATRKTCQAGDNGCTTSGRVTSWYGAGMLNVAAAVA